MYNRILLLLLVLAVTLPFMGCKKDDNHPTQYITGRVILTNTGKGITGSKVRLEGYSEKGCGFLYPDPGYCRIGYEFTTDSTGEFNFKYDRDNVQGDIRVLLRSIGDYGEGVKSISLICAVKGKVRSETYGAYVYLDENETHTDINYNVTATF